MSTLVRGGVFDFSAAEGLWDFRAYFLAQEVIEPSNPPQGKSLAWLEVFQFGSKKQDLLHCIKIEKFAGNIQSASLATRKLLQPSWCALAPRITTINCTILALLMLQAFAMLTPGTGRRTMNRTALAPISSITWQIYRAKWMQWNLKMNKLVQVHLWEHPQLFDSWLNFQHLLFWRRNCISSRKYKQGIPHAFVSPNNKIYCNAYGICVCPAWCSLKPEMACFLVCL